MDENLTPIDNITDLDTDEPKQQKRKSPKQKPVSEIVEVEEVQDDQIENETVEIEQPVESTKPIQPEVRKKRVYNRKKPAKLNTKLVKRTNSIFVNYRF